MEYGAVLASMAAVIWWLIVPIIINYRLAGKLALPAYIIVLLTFIASWGITLILIILLAVSKMLKKEV
jgi:hypothetical protein